jgi:hypothetical protein
MASQNGEYYKCRWRPGLTFQGYLGGLPLAVPIGEGWA